MLIVYFLLTTLGFFLILISVFMSIAILKNRNNTELGYVLSLLAFPSPTLTLAASIFYMLGKTLI